MLTSLLIAIGLNFDTFSVAIIEGAEANNPTFRQSLKIGLFFGIGQAFMALAGALLGMGFKTIIADIDHWVAFTTRIRKHAQRVDELREKRASHQADPHVSRPVDTSGFKPLKKPVLLCSTFSRFVSRCIFSRRPVAGVRPALLSR